MIGTCRLVDLLRILGAALVCAAFVVTPSHAVPESVTLYRGMTMIDGTGAAPKPGMAIITRGERIEAIIPDSQVAHYADNAKEIDAHGLYAIPGLIDSHVHLATAPNPRYAEALLRRYVYSGVTAVRDMAGDARLLADLSRASQLGEITAPDIAYAALMAGPEFFKDPRTVDSARPNFDMTSWIEHLCEKSSIALRMENLSKMTSRLPRFPKAN